MLGGRGPRQPPPADDPMTVSPTPADPPSLRLRLLMVVPFPPRGDSAHGGRVVAQLLDRLLSRHDVALVALREPDADPIDPALARRCAIAREIEVAPHAFGGPAWRHRQRMVTMPITGRPARVAVAHSIRLLRAVDAITRSWRPDVIQIEDDSLAYCAPRLSARGIPIVLVCHDPGLGVARGRAGVTDGRQQAAHRYEATMWERYWRHTFPAVDQFITFTASDAALLRSVVPDAAVEEIPLGIEIPQHAANPDGAKPPGVLFVGGYNHPPNEDAAIRLMQSIMPRVRARLPDTPLNVVGASPTGAMHAVATGADHITGRVENVEPYLEDAAVMALPIRLGGGMRVKLLEALAAGKAVVASPLSAAGLNVADGDQIVLAEDDDAFAAALAGLLQDVGARRRIAGQARTWAAANLGWDARVDDYERVYRRLRSASATVTESAAR
jgi:polysaccharide biosynthesis protein PslH